MAERIFVALDLETTGLDADRDAIIEIGVVRFQGDQIHERFTTLVNPQRAIPLRITQITGIGDAEVAAAPTLAAVIPELLAFVRGDVTALIAHNAAFDMGFLRAAGINFHRPALDTFELATILLPNVVSYSLGELSRQFSIPLVDAHRALDDAEATAQLFMRLQRQLATVPASIRDLIVASGPDADWPLRFLFAEARHAPARHAPPLPENVLPPRNEPALLPDAIAPFFAPEGPLAAQMGAQYEARSGQAAMAEQVLHALTAGEHLLVEAGTGTGKSLAYLLPAALWSVAQQQRVVVATNTIPLQDQLLHKDLPQVQGLLASAGLPQPNVALLKGRSHYLCTRRLHAWRTNHRLTVPEVSLLAKVLVWLSSTTSGDVSELLLTSAAERAIWQRLCSDSLACSPAQCGERIGRDEHGLPKGDFFLHAHHQAENAHLVVVNHALLLADLAAGERILPAYDHLIIDEAHHLEDVATEQLTQRVDWRAVQAQLRRLTTEDELIVAILREAALRQWQAMPAVVQSITRAALSAHRELDDFAARLLTFANGLDNVRRNVGYTQRVALDSRLRTQPAWSQLEIAWEQARGGLVELVGNMGELVQLVERAHWWQEDATAWLYNEIRALDENLQSVLKQLDTVIFAAKPQTGLVSWLEINDKDDAVGLAIAPLYVNSVIDEGLVQRKRSAIFTSATLRTHSGFDFIRERLGLWEVPANTFASPFDYATSTLLLLPSNLPAPNHAGYPAAVEEVIVAAALAAQGRTMVLFTSYAHLRTTAEAIRAPLDRAGITVLEHGGGSRNRLLREFRQTERAVLLGTRSFWEGVDLPGDDLCCLLIVRLPFAVPSDPLVAARTADLEDAFREYTLPEAILRFRQGFGRLIRRATDRGVVVVLDSRVWQRDYGRAFLDALPSCTVQRTPRHNLGEEIRKWLG